MCSAAVAIAAAALSYYLSARLEPSLAPSMAQVGNVEAAAGGHCAPAAADDVKTSKVGRPSPRAVKQKKHASR
jgi:hypothetical protein